MFQDRQAFLGLANPHFELHEIGQSLVVMVAEGAGMEEISPGLLKLSECSIKVLNLLHELEFEGMRDMHLAHDNWLTHDLNPMNQAGLEPVASGI
jgi:hypothetical protein